MTKKKRKQQQTVGLIKWHDQVKIITVVVPTHHPALLRAYQLHTTGTKWYPVRAILLPYEIIARSTKSSPRAFRSTAKSYLVIYKANQPHLSSSVTRQDLNISLHTPTADWLTSIHPSSERSARTSLLYSHKPSSYGLYRMASSFRTELLSLDFQLVSSVTSALYFTSYLFQSSHSNSKRHGLMTYVRRRRAKLIPQSPNLQFDGMPRCFLLTRSSQISGSALEISIKLIRSFPAESIYNLTRNNWNGWLALFCLFLYIVHEYSYSYGQEPAAPQKNVLVNRQLVRGNARNLIT